MLVGNKRKYNNKHTTQVFPSLKHPFSTMGTIKFLIHFVNKRIKRPVSGQERRELSMLTNLKSIRAMTIKVGQSTANLELFPLRSAR